MINVLLNDVEAGADHTSDWYPVETKHPRYTQKLKATTAQIIWDGVPTPRNGIVTIYGTNDLNVRSVIEAVTVNTASNLNDAHVTEIKPEFEFLQAEHIANLTPVSGGKIRVVLNYQETS
jgi:hypothetical protein